MTDAELEQAAAEAASLADIGLWQRAGDAYAEVGRAAGRAGRRGDAVRLLTAAADSFRRDDRPAAAARALRSALALQIAGEPARRVVALVMLAGVLLEAGQLEPAADLAQSAAEERVGANVRVLALDCLAGARLALGDVTGSASAVRELARVAPPAAVVAVHFRQAALARLAGDLDGARSRWLAVLEGSPDVPAWAGPRSAAQHDLGELALLLEDVGAARERFAAAEAGWLLAGRRAGVFRASAGQVRAALLGDELPLAASLDGPLAYAVERGLPALEVDLRLARAEAWALQGRAEAGAEFDRAIATAQLMGARLLEGRARAHRLLAGGGAGDVVRLRALIAADVVWTRRVEQAIGAES